MRRNLWIFDLVFVVFAIGYTYVQEQQTSILFIGNSYTYRNDMPKIFQEIALSKGRNVYVEHCTKGKATLVKQAKRDEVYEAIRSRKWDYIVLQASSRDLIKDSSIIYGKSIPALKKILAEIERTNPKAEKLFYMTWGYRNGFKPVRVADSYPKMTHTVKNGYLKLKEMFNIGVVPVGMAWYKVRQKYEDIVLYVKDGSHPSLKGSYLAACCFYSGIFREKAIGASYFSKLGPRTCFLLQKIASQTVLHQKRKYGLHR